MTPGSPAFSLVGNQTLRWALMLGTHAVSDMAAKTDEYRANTAECRRLAKATVNERDKQQWNALAESWLTLAQTVAPSRPPDSPSLQS
jgi:hypothetical protein